MSALNPRPQVSCVFLDNTYCKPRFVFPSLEEIFALTEKYIDDLFADEKHRGKKVLVCVGTYSIGKERFVRCVRDAYFQQENNVV